MPPSKTKKTYTSTAAPGGTADEEIISTEGLSFDLDEVTFDCHGQFDSNDMIDLAMPMADATEGWYDPSALAAVGRFYQQVMGEHTYKAFAAHRRRHRTPPAVVAEIMMDLLEELNARPPARPSPSPGGPPRTPVLSPAGSASPARVVRVPSRQAVDPEGIIPPEMAAAADVTLAPAPTASLGWEDPMAGKRRTVNLGDVRRTKVEPAEAG